MFSLDRLDDKTNTPETAKNRNHNPDDERKGGKKVSDDDMSG